MSEKENLLKAYDSILHSGMFGSEEIRWGIYDFLIIVSYSDRRIEFSDFHAFGPGKITINNRVINNDIADI